MNKPSITPQSSDLRLGAVLLIWAFQIIAFAYLLSYAKIEVPREYFGTKKVANHVEIWTAAGISLFGLLFGAILYVVAKCREELTCIRVLMNEDAGRTDPEPARPAPTPEENTCDPQAPIEIRHL